MVQVEELPTAPFDGATFQPEKDQARLGAQLQRVAKMLLSGKWYTLAEMESLTGDPQASISARIRDLRKPKFGGHDVQHRRRTTGQWEYRVQS